MSALCVTAPANAGSDLAPGNVAKTDNLRLLPDVYPSDPVLANGGLLREPYDPFFDVDWSVALRGTYSNATTGERFDTRLVPSISLEHIGTRSAVNLDASAEIIKPTGDADVAIGALRLGLKTGYDFDSVTRLTANGNFSLTQATPGTPGVASNIAIAPITISGGGDIAIARQMGRFNVSVTGGAQRNTYSTTTLTDGTVVDNKAEDYWALDSGLRVGFQATPIFEVFAIAGVGRDLFDYESPTLGVSANANDFSIKSGVTGNWNDILVATASAGLNLRRFDVATLGDVTSQLYDAQVIFTPDSTWRMRAGFATVVAPPGPSGTGTTRVDYTTTAELGYTVNSWLALRAMATWTSARFEGSADVENTRGLAIGADYKVNAHTAVTADYDYGISESSTSAMLEAHRVTVGVTLSR